MKVALVCPYDWVHPGGVRSHIAGLSSALNEMGVETTIFAPCSRQSMRGKAALSDSEVICLGHPVAVPANGSVARICFSPGALRRLRSGLVNHDVVHVHEPFIPSLGLLALRAHPGPFVATFHASAPASIGYFLGAKFLRSSAEKLAARIAVSEEARLLAARYFKGSYEVIPNGINLTAFSLAGSSQTVRRDPQPNILFVGRDEPRKGLDVALEAFASVRAGCPSARLMVAGAKRDRVPHGVEFLGALSDRELADAYSRADIFCAPSLGGESFGVVLLEAMASRTAIVASDLPAYRKVANGAAILVPPGDSSALASAIGSLIDDAAAREAFVSAGEQVVQEYSWARIALAVHRIYTAALS